MGKSYILEYGEITKCEVDCDLGAIGNLSRYGGGIQRVDVITYSKPANKWALKI